MARLDGRVLFVPGGVPGDRIVAHRIRWLGGGSFGRVLQHERRVASPLRREARCPHRPRCGGCPWHEIEPEARALAKVDDAVAQLKRMASIDAAAVPRILDPQLAPRYGRGGRSIVRVDPEWGYRLRARLRVVHDGVRVRAGFSGQRSTEVIEIDRCGLLLPALGEATVRALELARSRGWPPGKLHVAAGLNPPATGAVFVASQGAALGPASGDLRAAGFDLVEACAAGSIADPAAPSGAARGLSGVVAPLGADGPFHHDALTFVQAHAMGNRHLCEAVVRCAAECAPRRILELHAGAGNLTLALAQADAHVRAVEMEPRAVRYLRSNLAQARLADRIEVMEADASEVEQLLHDRPRRFDLLLLDPPRTGYRELEILSSNMLPDRIIYCSCDAVTLARDCRPLSRLGYRLSRFELIDMMPNTWHAEMVAVFDRSIAV
ncbi:MAG: class I SAM-dependent RNA methyltransferase [Deltaproteobacteria bacterium]|nr:class I SAM-dependent RNA methyltransferase [Deltaproteobacteria bacterium]